MGNDKRFNIAFIRNKIKSGWNIADYARYFGLSEEEFIKKLQRTCPTRVNEIVGKIRKNDKRKSNRKSNRSDVIYTTETTEQLLDEGCEDSMEIPEETIFTHESVEFTPERDESLESLKKRQAELENLISQLMSESLEVKKEHKKLYSELEHEYKLLKKMEEKILESKERIIQINQKMDQNEKSDFENEVQISSIRQELEAVKTTILKLSKVIIYCYDSGEIEVEADEEISVPEDCERKFSEMIADVTNQHLTVIQIRMLAKTYVLTERLQEEGREFQIHFESEILERSFKA